MRLGIDIGGTFTDIVYVGDDGEVATRKVLSSPDDYSRSIRESLPGMFEERAVNGSALREVIHGTTVATNAILEQRGANTALITTMGFRDVLELRRIRMPELYNWHWDKPPDLVERRLRFEVPERIDAHGGVLTPLDHDAAASVIDRIAALGVESIAICLINSYVNPAHEESLARMIAERHPRISVSVSSEILREVKEYERTATTVVNAYVAPIVGRYVDSLSQSLRDLNVRAPLMIMQSNGGVMTARESSRRPVYMIESGPAAGVIAAHDLVSRQGIPNAITLDMGGTTAKASIIEDGALSTAAEYEVGSSLSLVSRLIKGGGHLIRVPAIDVAEVGAGGGSIAWLDEGQALNIGPHSAGASPGPVCYDQGGTETTNTDANLVLGYINPEGLVGGGLQLDRSKAEQCVERQIAAPLGMSLLEAAYGVHLLANSNMTRAVRAVSTERGRDVRNFALIAFGGAGPLHACEMGLALGMKEAVIPPYPGLFSAFGLLSADIEHHYVQTYFKKTREADLEQLNATINRIEKHIVGLLTSQGFSENEIDLHCYADMRYSGQSYELTIPVGSTRLSSDAIDRLEDAYDAEHEKTYGHKGGEGEDYTFVNFRLIGRVARKSSTVAPSRNGFKPRRAGRRQAYFGPDHGLVDTAVLSRGDLDANPREGPLLIDEYDSTTVVPPGCSAWLDAHGNIRIGLQAP